MAVTQYIGARYVPLFADPAEWDSTREYEPLTVVLHQGASYTSRQAVPVGIDISNDDFWVLTGNYNAQVEQYRQEVRAFDGRITANASAISSEVQARTDADTALSDRIDQNASNIGTEVQARTDADSALSTRIDQNASDISTEVQARTDADTALSTRIDQNASDISTEVQARTDADTALSTRIGTTESTVASQGVAIAQNTAAIAALSGATPLCLIVGDSWAAFDEGFSNWAEMLSSIGWDYVSYAVGGTGWNHQGGSDVIRRQNFAEQLEYAYTQMQTADRNRVAAILVVGGVNDGNVNSFAYAATKTAINTGASAINTIRNNRFPNVPIYAVINAPNYNYQTSNKAAAIMHSLATEFDALFYNNRIIPLPNVHWVPVASSGSSYESSGLHLSSTGARFFGGAIASALSGQVVNSECGFREQTFTASGLSISMSAYFNNGIMYLNLDTLTGNSTSANVDFNIPSGWGPIYNLLSIAHVPTLTLFTNGGANQFCWCRMTGGATIGISPKPSNATMYGGSIVVPLNVYGR